jgi:hypothetical protein
VFTVVQDEQRPLAAQECGQGVSGGHARAFFEGEDLAHLRRHGGGIGDRRQVRQPHTVGIVVKHLGSNVDGQTGLAASA